MNNYYLAIMALINDKQRVRSKELFEIMIELPKQNDQEYTLRTVLEKIGELSSNNNSKTTDSLINTINNSINAYTWEITKLHENDINIISYGSEKYPELLTRITNPPLIIYHRGTLFDFTNCVAIVGTRNLSYYGHRKAHDISYGLAEKGFTIVSGLARGVDTEAHMGALDAGGRTIAVLAGNILDIYPAENQKIATKIQENGAIISEISSLEKIQRSRFVERNRITSGISNCVIIVESNTGGGTLHQVNVAKGQGKKIFVLEPPNHDIDAQKGFKEIISKGGEPFSDISEIIKYLKNFSQGNLQPERRFNQNLLVFL